MDYLSIISRIDAEVKAQGLKKAKFYEDVGVSSQAFSQWRTGETKPTNENLEIIANVLNMELKDLMFGKENKPALISESELNANLIYMLKQLPELRQSEVEKVLAYIQGLIANRTD